MVVALLSSDGRSHLSSRINLFVISHSTQSERAFQHDTTIAQIKEKLQLITGIPANSQKINLHAPPDGGATSYLFTEGPLLAVLDGNDARTLADYDAQDGYILKVTANDSRLGAALYSHVDDPSVQKFQLTDAEYANRRDTVMAYKARNKIGRFAETASDPAKDNGMDQVLANGLVVNCRVKVLGKSSKEMDRIGTVRFIGTTSFANDTWIGVQYDEPVGKNDGSIDGQRYFDCPPKYGGFVRPDKCIVGDWPSEDFDIDSD